MSPLMSKGTVVKSVAVHMPMSTEGHGDGHRLAVYNHGPEEDTYLHGIVENGDPRPGTPLYVCGTS